MKAAERCAYVYARVKSTMTLRTSGDLASASGLRHRRFALPIALAAAIVLLLTLLPGGSGAGVANYQGTLYLDGGSGSVSGNFLLTTTAGPAQGVTPVVMAGGAGSGGITGTYTYIYVTSSGGALTASLASMQANPNNAPVTVTNVPLGAGVYRQRIVSGVPQNNYIYIGTASAVPYVDTNTASTGAALPQADNRPAVGATGWTEFSPGVGLVNSMSNSTMTGSPSTPAVCKGWMVDASGGMSFPAGTWTFQARIKPGASASGTALLTAAMYRVNDAGVPLSTLVGPTDGASNMINALGTAGTYSVSGAASAFTLDTNEHLCVMFWRRQMVAYGGGGATGRQLALLAWDPANQVTMHPAPNAFAAATLSSPANALHTQAIPTLGATYSDSEGDAGTLAIRLCSDAGCSAPTSSGPMAANNGNTKTWTPGVSLADGTYYWSAQAQDALGLASAWTSARTFVLDTAAPTTSIDSNPQANSNLASGNFAFSANESVTGFQCRIDGGVYAACTSPEAYGPLADGAHTFSVKATADLAGNAGGPSSYGWTIDTLPPDTSITSQPSSLSSSASASFAFSATQTGSSFECNLDGAGFSSCSNPKSYSGLADGAHTFRVRAVDPAGNPDPSPDSYSWTIDATPPDTSIGPSYPAALTIATGATFDFSSNEAGSTFACSLDGASFTACASPKTYSALSDGSHTFQVRATDGATNTDPSPASHTWTIDTTPPVTSIGPTLPPANTSSANATFDLASSEAGSTFECRLDGGGFSSCASPMTYGGLADGSHTFDTRATDAAGNVDTSPASYSWAIDNVSPATPTLVGPADTTLTNALPQLQGTFDDATAGGDIGAVEFQICSAPAPAGTACAPVAQSSTSGSLSTGGTGSWTPAALADGTYHWQARAQDAAGNLSAWSATRSFQLDTSAPAAPAVDGPGDGAWVHKVELKAAFSKPSFAGTGSVEFRICSDGLCLAVVRSGMSDTVVNGAVAGWSPAARPGDGLWYWQARALDGAGNYSAWSSTRTFHLDTVAPPKPPHFNGQIGGDGLTLRWEAPNDVVANFVVFVDGSPWKNLGSTEFELKVGPFDATDTRTFSVVAVDRAGNVGAMSPVLVGVPNLVGLTWPEALGRTSARGLGLRRDGVGFASIPMFVTSQDPKSPALAERGSRVSVMMAAAQDAPLAVRVQPGRVRCARSCVLRLHVELSSSARVRSRLLSRRGHLLKRNLIGTLHAGTNIVRVRLPHRLDRGAYRLLFDATGESGNAHALVRVKVG